MWLAKPARAYLNWIRAGLISVSSLQTLKPHVVLISIDVLFSHMHSVRDTMCQNSSIMTLSRSPPTNYMRSSIRFFTITTLAKQFIDYFIDYVSTLGATGAVAT
jgi:hypothetical protein